jgi:trimethylamine--corrinoid protein Co-methyltransferase
MEEIHLATLDVLEEAGVNLNHEGALKLYDEAGAYVDYREQRVKIPEYILMDALRRVPKRFTLYARDPKHNLTIGGRNVYWSPTSTHLYVFDLEGERRPATFKDAEDLIKIMDSLPLIHGNACPVHPRDVPEVAAHVYMILASARNTTKTFRGRNYGVQIAKDCIRMAKILAGGEEEMVKKPNMLTITNTTSPLEIAKIQLEGLIEHVNAGLPVGVSSEISAGATGPVSLAGSLVTQNAEVLAGIALAELIRPGHPMLYGTVANIMDMKVGEMCLGSIEAGMLNVATAQMARYYGIPSRGSAGMTDSKKLDMQAGYEAAMGLILATLGGINYIQYACGCVDLTISCSYEKFIIDHEILGNIARLMEGIEVSDITLATDLIKKIGPGGHFLADKYTRESWEKEHFIPELTDRRRYDLWIREGRLGVQEKAREKVKAILRDYQPKPLDKDIEEELVKVVKEVEKREASRR